MSNYTPTVGEVLDSIVYLNKYHAKQHGEVDLMVVGSETAAQFRRMIASVEREAAARELAHVRREIRSIPHWWNSEEQRGGFDLQPLGPDATSEEGAFMEVMRVLDARAAEIREGGKE